MPASVRVGGFVVAVDAAGAFEVSREGIQALAKPAGLAWLTAARGRVHATDTQGSFHVTESLTGECRAGPVDDMRVAGSGVVLGGELRGVGCADVRYSVALCRAPERLDFRVAVSSGFDVLTVATPFVGDEHVFGAGEQFTHAGLDLRGKVVPIITQEGGVGRGKPVVTPLVELYSPGSGGSEQSTYYAGANLFTSAGRALVLDGGAYRVFDLSGGAMVLRSYESTLTGSLFVAKDPLALLEATSAKLGRMQGLPDWVHDGAIVALATDAATGMTRLQTLLDAGAKVSAVWNQTWSGRVTTWVGEQVLWNWTPSPAWPAQVAGLKARGVRVLCYMNSMLRDPGDVPTGRNLYAEALAGDYFVKNAAGGPYLLPITAFDVGLIDLTSEPARNWYRDVIVDELITAGNCDGWMADFGEALPFEAVLASGVPAAVEHNLYPVRWMALNREAISAAGRDGDILVFNRAGHTQSPQHAMLLWTGDQLTTWDAEDGIKSALTGIIAGGFSGITLNHSDTGGYTSLSYNGIVGYERSERILARWTEMNAFTAVLRTHEGNQPSVNAQIYDSATSAQHFARMSSIYAALAPYRRELVREAAERGWPVVRQLGLHYPDDATAWAVSDEFLLGPDVLVAPVLENCATCQRAVYLPAGDWVHMWSGSTFTGPTFTSVAAPLGEPPVFYRDDAPVGVTLAAQARALQAPRAP